VSFSCSCWADRLSESQPLIPKEVEELISSLSAAAGVKFTSAAVKRVFELTAGHPMFVRNLCSRALKAREDPSAESLGLGGGAGSGSGSDSKGDFKFALGGGAEAELSSGRDQGARGDPERLGCHCAAG
jgi:hypothetical protein